jgi:hypothetical protein
VATKRQQKAKARTTAAPTRAMSSDEAWPS